MQPNLSEVPTSSAQVPTNLISLCSFEQVVPDRAQAVADVGLHQSFFQEALEPTHPMATFREHESTTKTTPKDDTHKG